ncbi:ligand-binding sensor domain-containing protein [Chromatocurvus halotolerans]|uniref:Two component regulator with propeller domain n=1 Tax=Chromatocurvus halotolerans TaxID=1132028 RepID=A0A4R2KFX6_9GAMM|nr:two-component regulator propeller domain-containing protein [Chromatocurvus halotolerans]TCO72611.1 two component regulator with propeller domain [Chromatocurvus halotolerans]
MSGERSIPGAVSSLAAQACLASLLHLLAVLSLVAPAQALSPDLRLHQFESTIWTLQDGLPQVTVQAIAQGPEGYLWTGTQAGLSRFDGKRFEIFEPADNPAIPTLNIQALYLDSVGRLWIGTTRGPLYRQDNRFHAIEHRAADALDVHDFAETADGGLLIATDSGLWRTRGQTFAAVDLGEPASLRAVFHPEGESLAVGAAASANGRRYCRPDRGGSCGRDVFVTGVRARSTCRRSWPGIHESGC